MSRDMCRHERHPDDCPACMRNERDTLRLIVTEKFAGADMYVRPEDAADVAKWAAHPEAVRELLKQAVYTFEPEVGPQPERCVGCLVDSAYESHRIVGPPAFESRRPCPIAAAWRALGDPRGAADIERAHEEALREHRDRMPYTSTGLSAHARAVHQAFANDRVIGSVSALVGSESGLLATVAGYAFTAGQEIRVGDLVVYDPDTGRVRRANEGPFRLTSESQQAAALRMRTPAEMGLTVEDVAAIDDPQRAALVREFSGEVRRRELCRLERQHSDARGMEAVEDEARWNDLAFQETTRQADRITG